MERATGHDRVVDVSFEQGTDGLKASDMSPKHGIDKSHAAVAQAIQSIQVSNKGDEGGDGGLATGVQNLLAHGGDGKKRENAVAELFLQALDPNRRLTGAFPHMGGRAKSIGHVLDNHRRPGRSLMGSVVLLF